MSASVRVVWDDRLAAYDFGPRHPLAPLSVELTVALCRELGLLDAPGVDVRPADVAPDALIQLVHDPEYVAAVKRCDPADAGADDLRFGLGNDDNPIFRDMHGAAAHVVGATTEAARSVWEGEAEHAVSLAGGLHHAMPGSASGFCVYNDIAVAIAWLLEQGARRVVYVDVDVHHGDGVEEAFRDDPRVMTVSIHESGRQLFPGTGFEDDAVDDGTVVNVPLPAGTADEEWLAAFDAVVPPLVEAFAPDVLVTQHGCDGHRADPLAHLALTVDGQRAAYERLHRLAHEHAGGRWVATGGGGYAITEVVPRAWAHLVGVVAGVPVPASTPTPDAWRALVEERTGLEAPELMGDHPVPADLDTLRAWPDAESEISAGVGQVVRNVRTAVFPAHGLRP